MQPNDPTQLTGREATLNALNSISLNYGGASQALSAAGAGAKPPDGDGTVGPQGQAVVQALANSPLAKQYQDLVTATIAVVTSGN